MTSVISIAHSSSSMRPPPLLDTNDYHEPPSPSIHSNRSPASSSSSVSTYSPGDGDATIIGKRVGSEAGSEVSSNRPGLQKTRSQEYVVFSCSALVFLRVYSLVLTTKMLLGTGICGFSPSPHTSPNSPMRFPTFRRGYSVRMFRPPTKYHATHSCPYRNTGVEA